MDDQFLSKIRKKIDTALETGANPIAAFDADGTLWDMDMGEHFFQHQIEKKLLANLPKDAWGFYREFHSRDPESAFLWLAQVNKDIPIATVREWAKAAQQALPKFPVFPGMRSVIDHLHRMSVNVYVVTASVKWAVEPAAALLGIPQENVIGITTEIQNGIVTDKQAGPITWREGKVTGLLEATKRKMPFLSSGNTLGDLALLDAATHMRLVNSAAPPDHGNHSTERELLSIAKSRGWFYHDHLEKK